jgi:NADPH-dependent 2,4-dienoyl-CoA reductase/sulfur reductase-like enzyme
VRLASSQRLPYDKLCICAGARPKQLPPSVFTTSTTAPGQSSSEAEAERQCQLAAMKARVLTIRDTDSVSRLGAQLAHATRVAVVGNGGIALELMCACMLEGSVAPSLQQLMLNASRCVNCLCVTTLGSRLPARGHGCAR